MSFLSVALMSLAEFEPYMVYVWLGLFVLFLIIESVTTELVCVWFALGSLVSLFVALIPGCPFWAEILIFAVISALALWLLRPVTKRYLIKKKEGAVSGSDTLIGKEVTLEKGASEFELGEAKISGVVWSVRSLDPHKPIEKGKVALVVALDGNKLVCKEKENK